MFNSFIKFYIYMLIFHFIFSVCQVYTPTWPLEFAKCISPLNH